ncbi:MAG: hypothetical protein WC784_03315 [Candidatus Shapirobacteria bacterium]|jgi:hypothetical protein
MKHIVYVQYDETPPTGGFFGIFFNPLFWGFFLPMVYFFNEGGEKNELK